MPASLADGQIARSLTTQERSHLALHEATIRRGLQSFKESTDALLRIRDLRLFRETHDTMEDYCRDRWGITGRYSRMLCSAGEIVGRIEKTGTIVPKNEAQARPLSRLPAAEQPAAWQEAVESSGGQPTARDVQDAVDRRKNGEQQFHHGLPTRPRLEGKELTKEQNQAFKAFIGRAYLAYRRGLRDEADDALNELFASKQSMFVDADTPIEQIIFNDDRMCTIARNAEMGTYGAALARRTELRQIANAPPDKPHPKVKNMRSIGPDLAGKFLAILEAAAKKMRR